jgi:lincosamide nucleotidyltransferase
MLPQHHMIARVRDLCQADDRLDAAMMYGSFVYGEFDEFSDIEFLLFFRDDALSSIDRRAWLEQIAPVAHLYTNEHGILAAIFDNLVRGEFHFHSVAEMEIARAWPGLLTFPTLDSTLIVDKSGQLRPYLEPVIGPPLDRTAHAQFVADGFANWLLFGINVLRRGEYARALEILGIVHRHLLHMARLLEQATDHWLTPSRLVEQDLSPEAYARFAECVAAGLDADSLRRAYRAAWTWGSAMLADLGARLDITPPGDDLLARIGARL